MVMVMDNGSPSRNITCASVNLWGDLYLRERMGLLVKELENEFANNNTDDLIVIGLTEIQKSDSYDPMLQLAKNLGYSKENTHFFPTGDEELYGVGIITNCEVVWQARQFLSYNPDDPLEFGKRVLAMVELDTAGPPLFVTNLHLTVSPQMQEEQAPETLYHIRELVMERLHLPKAKRKLLRKEPLCSLSPYANLLILGDFNAAPDSPTYSSFSQAGFEDATRKLQEDFLYSWPVDADWFVHIHKQAFGVPPGFDVKGQQRWMDYILSCGSLKLVDTKLLGTQKVESYYPTDHRIPAATFTIRAKEIQSALSSSGP